ncbi:MAG: hypothetical protein M3540_04825 [Actinomycetota bacterium]|nr:hypothetical protein [Actinomycetota bacterium]
MPPDVSKLSVDELIRELGAEDPADRERAERELIRRALGQPSVTEQLEAALQEIRDAEVTARLREILSACRYYIRMLSVTAYPFGGGTWERETEFKFGTAAGDISVTTPDYRVSAGAQTLFGPTGVQIFNSAQAGKIHLCGDAVDHSIYAEAVGYGNGRKQVRFRCDGRSEKNWMAVLGTYRRFLIRRRVIFVFDYEIQTVCGSKPPW